MIYHCEDHTCNYWDEGEKLPERCPQCGRKLLRANEADMTGDDWTALGIDRHYLYPPFLFLSAKSERIH